jgi:hypothetical protein
LTVIAHDLRAGARERRHLLGGRAASAVSVFVIDCTTTGCDEPTPTDPTQAVTVSRREA